MTESLTSIERQEIIRNIRFPGEQAIKHYFNQTRHYKKNEQFFSREGFTFSIAKKIFTMAILGLWDSYYLFYYARRIPDNGTYLEIGSYLGGSLVCIYEATKISGVSIKIIAIEPFLWRLVNKENAVTTESQFYKNTKSIPLKLIKSKSDEAKNQIDDNSIDLLFIDGNHSYKQIKKDIENYWPKIKSNGILLGHDYKEDHLGIMQAVNEAFGKEGFTLLKNSCMWRVRRDT